VPDGPAHLDGPTPPDDRSRLGRLKGLEAELDAVLVDLDPASVSVACAGALYEAAHRIADKAGALGVLCARRATDGERWRGEGHRSAAHFLAARTRAPLRDAIDALSTSARLEWLPQVEDALRSGALSPAASKLVAGAAHEHPGAQQTLVAAAREKDFTELHGECQRIRALAASARGEIDRERRIRARRRYWSKAGDDGVFRFGAETTLAHGARLDAEVQARANVLFEAARARGEREPHGAYAVDALIELVTGVRAPGDGASTGADATAGADMGPRAGDGGGRPRGKAVTVSIVVSEESLRRGYRHGDETCEIAGVGPVPVAVVEHLVGDARLELVVRRGVDVASICSLGRTIPRALRSALAHRDPVCVVPGCSVGYRLEIHHWRTPFSKDRRTTADGTCRICAHHHDLVTYEGWDLVGGPGRWRLVPPGRGRRGTPAPEGPAPGGPRAQPPRERSNVRGGAPPRRRPLPGAAATGRTRSRVAPRATAGAQGPTQLPLDELA
jgi:Domain of unknown function (DUF222)